jgi:hypothetical protein
MALLQVAQFRIAPGRNQEFNGNVAKAKKIHERLGAQVRVWAAIAAGPNTGLVTYSIQHQDWAAYASFNEKLATDSEWQQFLASVVQGANPSGVLQSGALLNEITP